MKKRLWFLLIPVLVFGIIFYRTSREAKEAAPVAVATAPKLEEAPPTLAPVVAPEVTEPAAAPEVLAHSQKTLDYPPRRSAKRKVAQDYEYVEFPDYPLSLVRNLQAVLSKDRAGYEFVETSSSENFNYVFNKDRQKYGVWSREVVLRGPEESLRKVEESLHLEKVSAAYVPFAIFLVPADVSFETVYRALAKTRGISFEFDVSYARKKAQ